MTWRCGVPYAYACPDWTNAGRRCCVSPLHLVRTFDYRDVEVESQCFEGANLRVLPFLVPRRWAKKAAGAMVGSIGERRQLGLPSDSTS